MENEVEQGIFTSLRLFVPPAWQPGAVLSRIRKHIGYIGILLLKAYLVFLQGFGQIDDVTSKIISLD